MSSVRWLVNCLKLEFGTPRFIRDFMSGIVIIVPTVIIDVSIFIYLGPVWDCVKKLKKYF
jgi:hypothetical protein